MELILASNSPRRRELLTKYGFKFTVIKSNFEEKEFSLDPVKTSKTFAYGKALDVFNNLPDKKNYVVLGADTVVFYDNKILGKPKDEADAFNMLKTLSGKTHAVITSYCIKSEKVCVQNHVESKVAFNELTDELIYEYIKSGDPMDKAGSYGIQDKYKIVKSYSGSLNNIIGLPIEIIKDELNNLLK